MKNLYKIISLAFLTLAVSCSDISETQKGYTDLGEQNYVGKLDSVKVNGGILRAVISGQNTYTHNAVACQVWWIASDGTKVTRDFNIEEFAGKDITTIVVDDLAEGEYEFNVVTKDIDGNSSLPVKCFGAVYGPIYAQTQLGAIATRITRNDDMSTDISLSEVDDVTKVTINYTNLDGVDVDLDLDYSSVVKLPDWRAGESEKICITTHVLPEDKAGVDVIALTAKEFNITRGMSIINADKSKMEIKHLTKHDDLGYDITDGNAGWGAHALIDGDEGSQARTGTVPTHIGIDMGAQYYLNEVSVVGRYDYYGMDLVKLEIWGRETIDEDGKSHEIEALSSDDNFESEAVERGWTKVGNVWFTYEKGPRPAPTKPTARITELDHSIKPRYILFRPMTILTPDDFGGRENYDGTDGGYWAGDGFMNGHRRSAQIGEVYFKAQEYAYNIN